MIEKERKLRKLEDEKWKVLRNCNKRYYVSNYGRIKSFANNKIDGEILKYNVSKGFFQVNLSIKKDSRKYYVHKIVAKTWIPLPSKEHTFVTHLDGMLKNNHVSNLEWHTKESLIEKHREYNKNRNADPKNRVPPKNSKLIESDVVLLKSMLQRGVVQATIAKLFRISEMQVTRINRGENWGHVKAPQIEE